MKNAKKICLLLGAVLVLSSLLSIAPLFAQGSDKSVTSPNDYYDLLDSGELDPATKTHDPWREITRDTDPGSPYINLSKTATQDPDNENEFQISLTVEMPYDTEEVLKQNAASVVLVLDVGTGMDYMVDRIDGKLVRPGETGWDINGARWTIYKERVKDFIEKILKNPYNQISVVVHCGEGNIGGHEPDGRDVHKTICDWTNNANEAISSFYNYELVSNTDVLLTEKPYTALRDKIFYDKGDWYSQTNTQAGFRGAIKQLDDGEGRIEENVKYVIYMTSNWAMGSYEDPPNFDKVISAKAAIVEAGRLKSKYPEITLYTVGFTDEAYGSMCLKYDPDPDIGNPYVDEHFYAENIDALYLEFETLLIKTYPLARGWYVKDPMSDYVNLDALSITSAGIDGAVVFTVESGDVIVWDLLKSAYVEEKADPKNPGRILYVYKLTYTVTVDPEEIGPGLFPTNKHTTIEYSFFDDDGDLLEPETGNFRIPVIKTMKPLGSISKEALDVTDGVRVGDLFSYRITIENDIAATEPWRNVVVTDDLRESGDSLEYLSGKVIDQIGYTGLIEISDPKDDNTFLTITCTGEIASGGKLVVEIEVKVIAPAGSDYIENIIRAVSENGDDDLEDKESVKTRPDGSIIKEADKDEVRVDDEYTYTLTIENSAKATGTWKNVVVTDLLPTELDFISAVVVEPAFSSIDPEYDPLSGIVTIECGDIAPEEVVIVRITVKVNNSALAKIGKKIKNRAIAKSDNDDDQEAEDEKPIIKSRADSRITKVADPVVVYVGDQYTYTITLTNSPAATDLWKNVIMIDDLPSELDYLSYEIIPAGRIDAGNIEIAGQVITIKCGDIDIDETVIIKITVEVNDTALVKLGANIKNMAIATSDNDEDKEAEDEKPEINTYPDGRIKKEALDVADGVYLGDVFTYRITIENSTTASEPWKNVVVTDDLREIGDSLEYLSGRVVSQSGYSGLIDISDPEADNTSLTITCAGEIASGGKVIVEIEVKVIAPARGDYIENIIRAASDNGDDEIEDRESVKTRPDGSIAKEANKDEVRVDDEYTYTLTMENSDKASGSWKNVVVIDVLPAELDYVSAVVVEPAFSSIDPEYDPLTGTITIECGDIAPEGVVIAEITVKVNDTALAKMGRAIKNLAIAKSDNDADKEDEDEKPIIKSRADSSISKEADPAVLFVGDQYTYTITLANSAEATDPWKNVVLIDELPAELDYLNCEIIPAGRIDAGEIEIAGQVITIKCGDIAIAETVAIKITVSVNDSALAKMGRTIKNLAVATSDNDEDKEDEDENPKIKSFAAGRIKKEALDVDDGVHVGDLFTYRITIENGAAATDPWRNVVVTDVLPAELDFINAVVVEPAISSIDPEYDPLSGTVTVECGDIAPEGAVIVEITVKVNDAALAKIGDKIKNKVIATSDNDDDQEDEDERPEIMSKADSKIVKEADPAVVFVGDQYTYTITLTNSPAATDLWRNVVMIDELPAELDYLSYEIIPAGRIDASEVEIAGQVITVKCGDIAIGETVTIKITVRVNDSALAKMGRTIKNLAVATSDNDEDKEDEDENPRIKSFAAGRIEKEALDVDDGVHVGDLFTYRITIENGAAATDPWKNVVVTDILPAELDFISVVVVEPASSSIDPEYDPLTGTVTVECGDIAPEAVVIVEITVQVNDAALAKIGDKIKNKVIATSDNDDDQEDEDEKPEIKSKADSSITKEADLTVVHVGDEYTYTITLANSADASESWKNVEMIDVLPNELEYLSHEIIPAGRIDAADIDITGQVITMICGDIDIAETVTIKITVKVTASASTKIGEKIKNTAVATSTNDRDRESIDEKPEIRNHTVRYEANYPAGSFYVDGDLAAGSDYTVLTSILTGISRAGYSFSHWNTKADDSGTRYDPSDVFAVNSDVILYAQWTLNTSGPGGGGGGDTAYSVTYNANGGTGGPHLVPNLKPDSSHKVLDLAATGISRTGYTFLGWNTKADGSGISYAADDNFIVNSNLVLYAQWSSSTRESQLDTANHFAYIIGYPDGTVQPQGNITRAEVATIFFRLLTQASRAALWSKTNDFSDVPANAWFNNAISTLSNAKILAGYPDGSFKPKNMITRAELAAIAVRFASEEEIEAATAKNVFSDIAGHWAENSIITANALGYVNGYPDGTFRPSTPITRAEVATLINNVLNRHLDSSSNLHSDMKIWPDNQNAAWYYLIIQEATNSHYYERKADGINENWISMRTNPDWVTLEKPTSQPGDVEY